MARKIVAGNWKMNLNRDEAFALVSEITGMLKDEESRDLKVILFPSFIHLGGIVQLCSGDSRIHVGAQNCNDHAAGAFTGEVSAKMMQELRDKNIPFINPEEKDLNTAILKIIDCK